jgi:CRISPR-associated protein Cas5d
MTVSVKVEGKYALFTRPEFKTERVSYPLPTPGAARGLLENIFWRPEFSYQIREIWVLKPIQYVSLLRNEINKHQLVSTAKGWEKADGVGGFYADDTEDNRVQRHALCLKNVAYVIFADIILKPHANADIAKYQAQFRRRVDKGQCFNQPYLGTREFSVSQFGPFEKEKDTEEREQCFKGQTQNLGYMLFDIDFQETGAKGGITYMSHDAHGGSVTQGIASPRFFSSGNPAILEDGVFKIPPAMYEQRREDR